MVTEVIEKEIFQSYMITQVIDNEQFPIINNSYDREISYQVKNSMSGDREKNFQS